MNHLYQLFPQPGIALLLVTFVFLLPLMVGICSSVMQNASDARAKRAAEDATGPWVAEVWLEWPICRGSTMYRGRFASKERAIKEMLKRAAHLDAVLPHTYPAEYSNGRRYRETYDYGIYYGVRELTEAERQRGVTLVWTDVLPGNQDHKGEHSSAHPFAAFDQVGDSSTLAGSLSGYRI